MHATLQRIITGLLLGVFFLIVYCLLPVYVLSFLVLLVLILILRYEWPILAMREPFVLWPLALFYPILPCIFAVLLNQTAYRPLLFFTICAVMLFDTMSYVVGKPFGRHVILPAVSPGKSWEGFASGCCSVVLFTAGLLYYVHGDVYWQVAGLIGCMLSAVSLGGDLFESWLKRRAGVKDSGLLLPGHGGLLDRFDGLFFVLYIVYSFKEFLYKLFFV